MFLKVKIMIWIMKSCDPGESKKIVLQLWDERPRFQLFQLPTNLYQDVETWVHEFTEYSIWYTLHRFGLHKNILNKSGFTILLSNGETQIHKPAHVLTALHTLSVLSSKSSNRTEVCSPTKYAKMLLHS